MNRVFRANFKTVFVILSAAKNLLEVGEILRCAQDDSRDFRTSSQYNNRCIKNIEVIIKDSNKTSPRPLEEGSGVKAFKCVVSVVRVP
jgi:hypothetical protein